MFTDPYFQMTIKDIFAIRGRGILVTGQIESGTINVKNEVYIHRADFVKTAVITSIEMSRRTHQQAHAGDAVGLILSGISEGDVQSGDILKGSARKS